MRTLILGVACVFVGGLAVLTAITVVRDGPDALTVLSLLVLALLGFGVVGALLEPPQE